MNPSSVAQSWPCSHQDPEQSREVRMLSPVLCPPDFWLLQCRLGGRGYTGIWWVAAKDVLNILHKTLQQRFICSKMSTVQRVKNLDLREISE